MQRIRSYLRGVDQSDFASAEDFADTLFAEIEKAYKVTFESKAVIDAVKQTTKSIYSFFRLKDQSAFGDEGSPVRLKFGAGESDTSKFFGNLDSFYFSRYVDNSRDELKSFLQKEYLERGGGLFGRQSSADLDDFRKAANGLLDKVNDRGVEVIITSSVQRIRNYAHINSLRQAQFEYMRVIAIIDERTSEICRFMDGKLIKVDVAAQAVDRLTELSPGEYAQDMYHSALGKAYSRDPRGYAMDRVGEDNVVDDDFVAEGRGFPPYHPRCRTRVEGVFA